MRTSEVQLALHVSKRGSILRKEETRGIICQHCQALGPQYPRELADKGNWAWVHWNSSNGVWHMGYLCPVCLKEFETWMREET